MKLTLIALALVATQASAQSRCTENRQCELMWHAAQETLRQVSNMRVRLATDTRVETYGPVDGSSVAAMITKVPVGEKGYEFHIQVECFPSEYCADMKAKITKVFHAVLAEKSS